MTTSVTRNRRLLDAARDQECAWCRRQDGTVVAAHSNQLRHGKGMGIKAGDQYIAFLCHACHFDIDQGSHLSKEDRRVMWNVAYLRTREILLELGLLEADDQGSR